MPLTHSILHKISRAAPGATIETQLGEQENSSTGPIYSLFEQLKHSYLRSSQKLYGHFAENAEENPLPGWLKDYRQQSFSFISLSQQIVKELSLKLDNTEDAFSAHLLIAEEVLMEKTQLYIFWVEHTEVSYIDSDLQVASSRYIDSKKIHYAIKLQLDEWLEEDSEKYLSMITARGNKSFSEAFTNTVGFANGIDTSKDTKDFLAIVDEYAHKLDDEKAKEQKSAILEFCVEKDSIGEPVVIQELSEQLNEAEPLAFSSFVSDQQSFSKPELHTDRSSLKRYMRFFGRDKDMSISFSSGRFGEAIVYEADSGQLIIKQLPKSLKQQLNKHQQGAE